MERFDPEEAGEKFNPNLHEAVFRAKVEGKEEGSVFSTQQKGWILNGRVLRVGCRKKISPEGGIVRWLMEYLADRTYYI